MQKVKIDWEDFQDGSGAKAEISIRMLIGDKFGNDECYNKAFFTVAVAKKPRERYFRIYINSKFHTESKSTVLDNVKKHALECLSSSIEDLWLVRLFRDAEQTSHKGIA